MVLLPDQSLVGGDLLARLVGQHPESNLGDGSMVCWVSWLSLVSYNQLGVDWVGLGHFDCHRLVVVSADEVG